MNSSKIKTWEGGKKESVFLRLGILGIDPKEQIKGKVEGLIKEPKLWLHRFQDARMRLLKQTMAKKVTATAAHDDKTTHLGKQKKTAAIKVPPSRRGVANHHLNHSPRI
jgi:hypothetical protein